MSNMQSGDAVDALFSEAFALLEQAAPASSAAPRPPTAQRRKPHGEGGAARRKRWLCELRNEATVLRGELQRLRDRAAHSAVRERALDERAKRRRAERECAQLREALYQHTQFLRGLRGVLSIGMPSSPSLNLYHLLHNFTRLPRDSSVRQLEYEALRRDQRFAAAMEMIEKETAALPVKDAHSQVDFAHASDEPCAITTKRVYVVDTEDVAIVRRVACVAVHDLVARCRTYQWVGVAGASVDVEALEASGGQYTVTNIHRTSEHDPEGFSVESRVITMQRMVANGGALVVWDFVDEDELHPLGAAHDIFRQGIGACLIRREICSDGVTRTVYREVSTRRYEYRGPKPPSAGIDRYFSSKRLVIRNYERLYHDLMLAHIAREKEAIQGRPRLE